MFKRFIRDLVGIGLLALLLSNVSLLDFTSLDSFMPQYKVDFEISDFYNVVSDARQEKILDNRIVIVPIDSLSRHDISDLIEDISLCNPTAIGLDVFFQFSMDGDEKILSVLRKTTNLVTPVGLRAIEGEPCVPMESYMLDSLLWKQRGVVNMNITQRNHVVRSFIPFYRTSKGELPHFAISLAKCVYPESVDRLLKSGDATLGMPLSINYPAREFDVVKPEQLLENIDAVEGKIVLLGALQDMQDTHITPVSDSMPGVLIHAYALSTVLDGSYSTFMPKWALWIFSLIICVFFVMVNMWMDKHVGGKIGMRFFQIVMTLLIVYLGCVLFIRYNFVLELTLPMMIVALGMAALDIWNDILKIIEKMFKKIKLQRMTKILLLVFLNMAFVNCMMAGKYRVFRYEGEVRILNGNSWSPISARQSVTIRDQFQLGAHAKLGIVDDETHRIYYTTEEGKINVAKIISNARKQSDRLAFNMSKQIQENSSETKRKQVILGGVNRGSQLEATFTEYLYSQIYNKMSSKDNIYNNKISARKIQEEDSYYFCIKNDDECLRYVNIIRLPALGGEKPYLCLEIGYTHNEPYLVVAPHQEVKLSHLSFLNENIAHSYLLLASETPFDCQMLKMMLSKFEQPMEDQSEYNENVLFFKFR